MVRIVHEYVIIGATAIIHCMHLKVHVLSKYVRACVTLYVMVIVCLFLLYIRTMIHVNVIEVELAYLAVTKRIHCLNVMLMRELWRCSSFILSIVQYSTCVSREIRLPWIRRLYYSASDT